MAVEYFGNNTDGTTTDYGWGNYTLGNKATVWTCPGSGKYDLRELAYRGQHLLHTRIAIYTTSLAFVFQGIEDTSDQALEAWHTVTGFRNQDGSTPTSPQLDGGTNYILMASFAAGSGSSIRYSAGSSGDNGYFVGDNTSGFPATGPTLTSYAGVFCLRCGVEAAAAGGQSVCEVGLSPVRPPKPGTVTMRIRARTV